MAREGGARPGVDRRARTTRRRSWQALRATPTREPRVARSGAARTAARRMPATPRRRRRCGPSCWAAGSIPAALVTRALDAGWPVVPTYGLSEAGSGVTALATGEAREAPSSAGRPLPGVTRRHRRAGRRRHRRDRRHDAGPVHAATSARPPADGPIRTGDLGRLDDAGRLYVLDRRTDRIVRGGENISPAEVEAVLAGAARDRRRRRRRAARRAPGPGPGRGDRDSRGDAGRRRRRSCAPAAGSLAAFKVPAAIVRVDALPRTPGGKLRREAVRALVDGGSSGILARPGGDEIGWRRDRLRPDAGRPAAGHALERGPARPARDRARAPGDATVHAIDRRGMGTSRLADPRPLDVDVHVRDLVAYLDARGIERAMAVGISFGGVVALELAARQPGSRPRSWSRGSRRTGRSPTADPRAIRDAGRGHGRGPSYRRSGGRRPRRSCARSPATPPGTGCPERAAGIPRPRGRRRPDRRRPLGLDPDGLASIAAPTTILTGAASDAVLRADRRRARRRHPGCAPRRHRGPRPPRTDHRRRPLRRRGPRRHRRGARPP